MSEISKYVKKSDGEEIELRFKPVKGKNQAKMLTFLARIVGGDFIKNIVKGGLDVDVKDLDLSAIISNLTDENVDRLCNKFCDFVIAPPLKQASEEKREQFFEQFDLKELIPMLVSFVIMALTGSYPDNIESLKK